MTGMDLSEFSYNNGYAKGQSDCLKKKYRKNTIELVQAEQYLVRRGVAQSRDEAREIIRDVCKLMFEMDIYNMHTSDGHNWKLLTAALEHDESAPDGVSVLTQKLVCEECGEVKFVRTLIYP